MNISKKSNLRPTIENRQARFNYELLDDFEAGIPESFNVLIKELKSLGLNVNMDLVD